MPRFLVVAFYTIGTLYETEARELATTCRQHHLSYDMVGYEPLGHWVLNAGIKPTFLLEMMEKYKYQYEYILYLDADARIRQYPKLFDTLNADIGVHFRYGKELLSGTIFLRNRATVRQLIRYWIAAQAKTPAVWDQKIFQRTLIERTKELGVRVTDLPPTYTQIFDSMAAHGEPVIEHMQASRRYKAEAKMEQQIPNVVGKSRIRRGGDGCIFLVRKDLVAERWLDTNCIRFGNERKWYPKIADGQSVEALRKYFEGKSCYIVGKGPSLDKLAAKDFPKKNAPIIGINEAVYKVESLNLPNPVFCVQQDASLKGSCYPKTGTMLVSAKAASYYEDKDRVFVFDSRHYGLSLNALSASAAIGIAKRLGATSLGLYCFDACVTGTLGYAKCIPYPVERGGKPDRFLHHRKMLETQTRGIRSEWIIPGGPALGKTDKPQRKSDNPKEHRVPSPPARKVSLPDKKVPSSEKASSPRASQPDR